MKGWDEEMAELGCSACSCKKGTGDDGEPAKIKEKTRFFTIFCKMYFSHAHVVSENGKSLSFAGQTF